MVNALSFQLKKQIYSKFWDAERNLVLETFSAARSINDYLTLVKADILRYYNIPPINKGCGYCLGCKE